MVFCQACGTKAIQNGKFCHSCGMELNGTPVPGDVKSLSFDDYKKKKEDERRSKFKKANTKDTKRPAAQKSTNEVAKVQVGLVTSSPDSDHLKKMKGRTIPVLIDTRADASTLLHTAVEKHGRHFKQFSKHFDYVLLYPDMSVVQNLPASNTPFTVEKYKRDLLKPYSKMYFWLCAKDDFESANNVTSSDSEDDMLTKHAFEASYNSSNVACDVPVLTPPEVAIRSTCPDLLNKASTSSTSYHQCPTCLELFPQSEIEVHADACAEAWVDPIGDLDEVDDAPPNEVEPIEDATGTLREPLDINLETLRNEVSNLRRLCQCELTNRVSIRRRLIFQDYMDTRKKKWFKPKAMLKVTYVGEPAVDDGGPKREFFTEIFGHIRRTLFSDDGVPKADMRALANDEFKAVGELMACSLIQGGPAPCFLSVNVYDYLIDGMASVQSEKWASLIKDDFLRQSLERIAACKTNDELGALLCEESMMDILQMVGYRGVPSKETLSSVPEIQRSFVITGIARTLTTIDQMITGLASFGALDYIRSHKNVMKPLFTLDGARHFQPTPELFIEGLNVLFSEEGSNHKASEIDVFKNFCDFVQDLGTTQGGLVKLYKFITGSDSLTPLGLERVITVHFKHFCMSDCKCRPTASTCDPSINLPVHYRDMLAFEEVMTSALEEGLGFGLI
ncbi:uncharacterized protein [Acropora muricata]|uniref:uncharacterized protein n=1 Tax=Acropora muricata TaxID=159855 RepID=UPI0034E3E371